MTVERYLTLAGPVEATIEDRRSVFECWLRPVDDEDAAREVVAQARATHWDARHHCSAFVLTPDGSVRRSNDDGEPAGTAGAPMLEVLSGSGMTNLVAVVTRWFGGVLLGAGGLVRAYGDAVRAALAEADATGLVLARELATQVDIRAGHDLAGRLEHDLRARGVQIAGTTYGQEVTLTLQVPRAQADGLEDLLGELTAGRAHVIPGTASSSWVDVEQGDLRRG